MPAGSAGARGCRSPGPARTWILKTEPAECGIDDIREAPRGTLRWDGIRNYQARNFLREMRAGDLCLVYHSGVREPALVGCAKVLREAFADPAQFDPASRWHDPASRQEAPRWLAVDIRYVGRFRVPLALSAIRAEPRLASLALLRQARLSVSPVTEREWGVLGELLGEPLP